jgi:uncharacterized protein YukE
MKKTSPHRISTEVTSEKIKIVTDIDLNALFNLNYNFDLLKGIIETLLKNQGALQKQLDEIYSSNEEKDNIIQNLEKEIKILKDTTVSRDNFKALSSVVDQINNHLKQNDKKIDECNLIIIYNYIILKI